MLYFVHTARYQRDVQLIVDKKMETIDETFNKDVFRILSAEYLFYFQAFVNK